jgi:hypothetical protein
MIYNPFFIFRQTCSIKPFKANLIALGERHIPQNGAKMAEKWGRTEDFYDNSELYRLSYLCSEIRKAA